MIEQLDYAELQRRNRTYVEMRVNNDGKATWILEQQLHIKDYTVWEKGRIRVYERLEDTGMLNKALLDGGVIVSEMSLCSESLEDHFIKLTGSAKMIEVLYCEWRKLRKSAAFGATMGLALLCPILFFLIRMSDNNFKVLETHDLIGRIISTTKSRSLFLWQA